MIRNLWRWLQDQMVQDVSDSLATASDALAGTSGVGAGRPGG